jgi:hypothetical protein
MLAQGASYRWSDANAFLRRFLEAIRTDLCIPVGAIGQEAMLAKLSAEPVRTKNS